MVCQGKMEAHLEWEEPTSVDMKPEAAQLEVPKEGAAVMLVRGPRKRHMDRNPAAGCNGQPKERTQGCGSRKKATIANRKVSRHAAAARRRRDAFGEELTQGTCGSWRKELATTGRGMTHRPDMARHRGDFIRKCRTGNDVRGAPREQTPG
jgi:hypothetical protein